MRYRNDNSNPKLEGFVADYEPQNHITDCFKKGWTAGKVGDTISFTVTGSCIAVQYRKSVKLPAPVAKIIVDGDEEHGVLLDANFDETWGDKLELDTILEHGEEKNHTVQIRIVDRLSGRSSVLSGFRDCILTGKRGEKDDVSR